MVFRYRYVKVTDRNNNTRYFYERSILGFFPRYAHFSSYHNNTFKGYRKLDNCEGYRDLDELKILVEKYKRPKYIIKNAETKLERNLSGL